MSLATTTTFLKSLARAISDSHMRNTIFRTITAEERLPPAHCPCCGFGGRFAPAGMNARLGQLCPRCKSYERHRLVALAFERGFLDLKGKDVVHFAPERAIQPLVRKSGPASYVTGDIVPGRADKVLNLEQIDLPDASFDVAIASHVLEHVDDRKTLAELRRILRPGGQVMIMVPLVEGWDQTFEDASKTSHDERQAYFGRYDHVRYYGADFRGRVRAAGFALDEFTAGPVESVDYRLSRGEKIFLATKTDG
ncbi:methyltransferase domain-containing protein [Sphingosinicella terrae]|uniref:methyltransferase domain-containing protein n=1 Tax=Sphingosinicella terrae TaxID=2172047 RepID=UPI0013B36B4F|nr:class I SAM-dependent methyltransferase [Sphingosinicella terrae]